MRPGLHPCRRSRRGASRGGPGAGGRGVADAAGQVFVAAARDSPTAAHISRVPWAGGAVERLSKSDGLHSASFANNASVYVDSWSNPTTPPQLELYRNDGSRIAALIANDLADPKHPNAPDMKAQRPR
ncbi:DPP IV N-terminal domain-containing protein, partial [Streptomyces sp. NPDC059569]|uniref:DPP IV N-terminal domain-containing protein n=1 Tax=Streptomyces sp. NPDC059569 TaxID=3346869 RepID=UPI0036AB29FD